METKALKKQLGAAIAMVLVAAIALGAATFAWFVNNNAVTATNVDVSTSSSVPNLYIESAGNTTGIMSSAGDNPTKLYPVSTSDAKAFFETKHWTSGTGNHAVADEYQNAIARETDKQSGKNKTVYADYTYALGVTNGSMDVYFDSSELATTLKANPDTSMGTAGRFAISFDNGTSWKLFKVNGTATGAGYYTDQKAEGATEGDFWVTGVGGKDMVAKAAYSDMARYSGSINGQGQAVKGTEKLTTITSDSGPVNVIVRVWYEGCDKDCVSENAQNGIASAITGNLGFVGVQPTETSGVGA